MTLARTLAVAMLAVAVGAPAATAATDGTRQTVTAKATTTAPGAPMGVTVSATYSNGASDSALPHSLRHVSDGLPAGTTVRTGQTPVCAANDLELTIFGAAACPPGSLVGTGTVLLDFGIGPLGRLKTDVTLINAGTQILFLGREPNTGIELVDHGILHGSTIEIDIPQLPGATAEGAVVDMESFSITQQSGLLISPATCPSSGHWTFRRGHTYGDHVTQYAEAPMACSAPVVKHRRRPAPKRQRPRRTSR